jgi:hypothetical protein
MPYRTEMYVGADLKSTTLSAGISATDTTIPAVSLAGWPTKGYAAIFTSYDPTQTVEIVEYTGISGNSLTGVTRGHAGTQQAWPQGAYLEIINDWHYFQRIVDNVNELFPAEGVTRVRGDTRIPATRALRRMPRNTVLSRVPGHCSSRRIPARRVHRHGRRASS